MFILNVVLLIHFVAFILFLVTLIVELVKPGLKKDYKGLLLGVIILLTGIALVALNYPHVKYYKVIPKLSLFLVIATIKTIYGEKVIPRSVNYLLLSLTILASLIAVVKV
jgi:hypothetical protein